MEKQTLEIKPNVKMLSDDVQIDEIKNTFGCSNEIAILDDMLSLILHELQCLTKRSRYGNYRYLLKILDCIRVLIYELDLTPTNNIYIKIQLIIETINNISNSDHNKNINTLVGKIKQELEGVIKTVDSYEYQHRHEIEEAEKLQELKLNNDFLKVAEYILFNIRDIKLITKLRNEYFRECIINNISDLSAKACLGYLNSKDKKDKDYYKLLLTFLSSDLSYGLSKEMDNIIDIIKKELNRRCREGLDLTDDEVTDLTDIIKLLKNNNTKDKYNIPTKDNKTEIIIPNSSDRLDLRDKFIFTIDESGADCLDDAISYEKLPNGNFIIGIYIADISDIVLPLSELDKYAYSLGETIFHKKDIPMLPSRVYDIASLSSRRDRLVHAYRFEINEEFKIVDVKINKAIINIIKNYTYKEIDALISEGTYTFAGELRELYKYATHVASKNQRRITYLNNKEMIDPSRKFRERFGNSPSNKIVSELKVLVNSYLALVASSLEIPFIYRNNLRRPFEIDSEIEKILKENNKSFQIKSIIDSSFQSSYYSATNMGHYGLNVKAYAHATTPLRNYASLYNQRMISTFMIDGNKDKTLFEILTPDLAEHLNKRIILNRMYTKELASKRRMLTK